MISDVQGEDADALDDDEALESLISDAGPTPGVACSVSSMPEWPPRERSDVGLPVDAETLAWFRSTHADWRRQMGVVLRAWMIANTVNQTSAIYPPSVAT
jgi:uncharacterized protein (DUF4415 family)